MEAIKHLSVYYLRTDTLQSKYWCSLGVKKAKEWDDPEAILIAYENFGRYYTEQGNYDSAIYYLQYGIINFDIPEYYEDLAATYISLGNVYDILSDYEKALDCYLQGEQRYLAGQNFYGAGLAQMGIGNIYNSTGMFEESKTYFRKSYRSLLPINEVYASWSMNNLATAMTSLGEYDSALYFFDKSLTVKLKYNDFYGASYTYNDMGSLYYQLGKYDEALESYLKALATKEVMEGISKETLSNTNLDVATIYFVKKDFAKALEYANQGLQYAFECSSLAYQAEGNELLAKTNYELGNYQIAYNFLYNYIFCKDSLDKKTYNSSLAELQTKYDTDEKKKEIELLNTSNKLSQLEAEQSKKETQNIFFILIAVSIILGLAIFLGISLYRSNKAKHKTNELLQNQNDEIQKQKVVVEEKNKEILDSITYARRIQNAILPTQKRFKNLIPESFVLYKPKDIVAGDFYWLEEKGNKILLAAADCTGHGVPGAMVSVVCNNGLNRSVREYGITDPGKILDKTREIVIAEFEKSDDEVKDGMDISLVVFDKESAGNISLQWAGANNPIWIFKNGSNEFVEIKADKQPIGKFSEAKNFTTHFIELQIGDLIILFTDGYQDQFGGDASKNGKKFKASRLKELIQNNLQLSMYDLHHLLNDTLINWQGSFEQIDDICVIGVRV